MVRIVKDPEERKWEIIEAATDLFLTKGYDRTTMKDVMARLGIAKGTIYHYFRSKEELCDAVVDWITSQHIEKMQKVINSSEGSAMEMMRGLIETSILEDCRKDLLEHLHQPGNTVIHLRLLAKRVTMEAPLYARLIDRGCQEGFFTTEFPLESAEFIQAAIRFLTDVGIYPWSQDVLRRRTESLPYMIERHLGAPSGSFDFIVDVLNRWRAENLQPVIN